LHAALEEEGIEIVLNAGVERVARGEAVVAGRSVKVSHVLIASGRVPNVEELNLAEVGVETGRGGIVVDGRQRTSVEGIWAAGDVAVGPWFTPTAQYQARIAIDDMFDGGTRTADYSFLPTAIFTDPELGAVGLTEEEARAQGGDVGVATQSLRAVTRAQYYGAMHGLFKLVYDKPSRRLLGVHVVSRDASDIVGSLAVALSLGATVDDLAAVHHVYPSFSEGLKAAAEQAV
jgi:mercuric reductase